MTPSQKVADSLLADETLVHEHPQDLGAEEAFEVAGVEASQIRAVASVLPPPSAWAGKREKSAWCLRRTCGV